MATITGIKYNKTILSGGLRVVSEQVPAVRSVAFGVLIDVGSRDETEREKGASHFIEHMLFKGTRRRSAKQIATSVESLGGSLNAFTSREQTCYHAIVLDEHLGHAIDVISDIMMNSTFTPHSIEREKQVVAEEIREIEETPSDLIHELFASTFWRGQSLGSPIMGSKESVKSLTKRRLKSYMNKHYSAGKIVIAAAGNVSHRKLVSMVKEKFDFASKTDGPAEKAVPPSDFLMKLYNNGSNQAHICLGFPGLHFGHLDRFSLLCLHTYLGGGMSSVLFQKIREEKGMAYTVYTFTDFYRDTGIFGIYLATDRRRVSQAIEIILRELGRVKRRKLGPDRLDIVKAQMKGNLTLGMESTPGRMNRLGRHELMLGRYVSLQDALKAIDRTTSEQLIRIARTLLNHDTITVTSLGPVSEDDLKAVDWSLV
ncbi:MAG: insulinase family protein [Candidatus Zixiibacteriota bacterium]|nr:MAG: insulinase family protein [candidate division Zixibacteria bacterium]